MPKRLFRILLYLLLLPPILAGVAGWLIAPAFLDPVRRELTPDLIREADASFAASGGHREDFTVRAPDGVELRGWLVRSPHSNGNWVLLFHGVADNRIGVIGASEFLLRSGYNVVMMDARAHGASGGAMATYGWLERTDTRAIIDALLAEVSKPASPILQTGELPGDSLPSSKPVPTTVGVSQNAVSEKSAIPRGATEQRAGSSLGDSAPRVHLFALGESMGAGIALQSAAADARIEGVVAEASFADLREATYDYAGMRRSPLLGKTLFRPFSWTLLAHGEKLTGFPIAEVSPAKAVAARPFPVLLICDENDEALPCRHTKAIYAAAAGPKQFWEVPGAFHTAALGMQPAEFERRVLDFYANIAASKHVQ